MINLSILISSSKVSGPGGLFDFNATLPLVAIQFLLLMVILNIILYNPALRVMNKRDEYIRMKMNEAFETLTEASELTKKYEQTIDKLSSLGQLDAVRLRSWHKILFELEVSLGQAEIDRLLDSITNDLRVRKDVAFKSVNNVLTNLIKKTFEAS